jgi:tRNA(fMet)-specific endonuclease VapC
MILDTSFFIRLQEQDSGALQKARIVQSADVPLRIPSAVLYELYISVGKAENQQYMVKNQRALQRLIGSKPVVEMTSDIAKRAGVLEGSRQKSDTKPSLGSVDAIVAATAQFFNEPIICEDSDFSDIPGVSVESF